MSDNHESIGLSITLFCVALVMIVAAVALLGNALALIKDRAAAPIQISPAAIDP